MTSNKRVFLISFLMGAFFSTIGFIIGFSSVSAEPSPDIIYTTGSVVTQVSQDFLDRLERGEVKPGDTIVVSIDGVVQEMPFESGSFRRNVSPTV